MLFSSIKTSVPKELDLLGVQALTMFVNDRDADTWQQVFDEIIEAGYDLQNMVVPGVDVDSFNVFASCAQVTSAYPLVVTFDVRNRIYVTMFDQFRSELVIEYLRARFAELAAIEEIATISLRVQNRPEKSILNVAYQADDKVERRDLISMVSQVTAGFLTTARLISYESNEQRLTFELSGEQYLQATDAVRIALAKGYKDMIAEVGSLADLAEVATFGDHVKKLFRTMAGKVEVARVFDDAAPEIGSRVIVNDGTAANPKYFLGDVTGIIQKQIAEGKTVPRIKVMLDSGREITEQIDNGPTGMLGYANNHRRRLDPIDPQHVSRWLDTRKWMSKTARALCDQGVMK